nr:MAG TPA: hypothetical protein [Caudoviricetes sp.]DAX27331.1 MAG TPA: hypothetical protein [Caudoviricetes sp.]
MYHVNRTVNTNISILSASHRSSRPSKKYFKYPLI